MRAAVCARYGPPETLELRDVPVPGPKAGEIRCRVHATTVNRTDTATLRAYPFFARPMTGWLRPKMKTLGMDFAGIVDAVGAGVTRFKPGDRVFGLSPVWFGAHAEYMCLPADGAVAPLPAGVPFQQAVVCEGAWYASSTAHLLTKGKSGLIYGASGAIGTAAVQLAKANGAQVTAVVGTRHMGLARDLGADRVINYQQQDFTAIDDRFDVVMDAVGHTSWFACRHLLKPGGIYAATDLGPYWSNLVLGAWFGITGSGRVRVPFPKDSAGFVRRMAGLLADGTFKGVFDRTYSLDHIVDAFKYVEQGQKTGIVVVEVRPDT